MRWLTEEEPITRYPPFDCPPLQSVPIDETGTPKIMDKPVTPIIAELPSNEIPDDKLHQSAPENANLPNRQVRKE